jgi:2-phospho-L-lactate guanylyltransferase
MNLYALVPVKDPRLGKSRLAPVLAEGERRELNLHLARRTLDACVAAFGAERTVVVTNGSEVAAMAAQCRVVWEGAAPIGLNPALRLAARHALAAGAEAFLVVPADLPLLSPDLLRSAATRLHGGGCLLVPDLRGTGTNLLGLAPARADLFRFGDDSFRRHAAAAARAGLPVRVEACRVLGQDLDVPADLNDQLS